VGTYENDQSEKVRYQGLYREASALNSSTSLGTSPWIVKERTSANAQAAYSTNRARAQAAHDAALLSAVDNGQTSNRTSNFHYLQAKQ
jgi:hypothetical protein